MAESMRFGTFVVSYRDSSHKYTPQGVKLLSSAGDRRRHQQNMLCECPLTRTVPPGPGPRAASVGAGERSNLAGLGSQLEMAAGPGSQTATRTARSVCRLGMIFRGKTQFHKLEVTYNRVLSPLANQLKGLGRHGWGIA